MTDHDYRELLSLLRRAESAMQDRSRETDMFRAAVDRGNRRGDFFYTFATLGVPLASVLVWAAMFLVFGTDQHLVGFAVSAACSMAWVGGCLFLNDVFWGEQ